MKIFRQYHFFFFFLISCLYLLSFLILNYLLDGFSPKHISAKQKAYQTIDVESPLSKKEILSILSQKYYYLSKGSQCYVFESEDKQFILKFFRFPRYTCFALSDYAEIPSFLKKIEEDKRSVKKEKMNALFASCRLAYTELQKESGLLYLHLNKSNDLQIRVSCYDKLKRNFQVDMDQTEFIVQKRAELLYPYLMNLMKKNRQEEAKKALVDLIEILNLRLQKGIFDNDSVIAKNAGFHCGKAMFIDIGEFKKDRRYQDKDIANQEIDKITRKLRGWLNEKDPELAGFLDESIERNKQCPTYQTLIKYFL